MAKIQALVVRDGNNEIISAVGVDDHNTSVLLSLNVNLFNEATSKALSERFHPSEEGMTYLESECYHLTGTFGEVTIAIETIDIK